jgi:hypothetical protein
VPRTSNVGGSRKDDYVNTTPILERLALLARETRALDARRVEAAGEFAELSDRSLDKDGLSRRAGYPRPALMLADLWQIPVAEAQRFCDVGLAVRARWALDGTPLPPRYPLVAAAIEARELSVAAAAVIIHELEAASPRCSTERRELAEYELVTRAPDFPLADLHTLARQVRDRLDQDGVLNRDAIHRLHRSAKFIPASNGMVRLVWDMPPATAGLVKTAVDAVVGEQLRAARDVQLDDVRTLEQRRADAAEHLFHHVATCGAAGGDLPAATMVVRLSLDDLRSGSGSASIDGIQETISIATARRLAADAELIPVVLGGKGEILDAGRARRLFSRTQRLALMERDDGCAFAGCTSPPAYADAHHIQWWSHGGTTDLANGVMLCGFHHHRVHDDGWEIRIREGIPYFIPPPWVDPDRRARRGGRIELSRV